MQTQATELVTGTERPPTDWQSVDWRKANRVVRNLRQRIFRATQEGEWNKVRSLQKLMLRSYSNTLVSVRRVTQENTGKRTPGVDKLVVKTPALRGRLVDLLMTSQPWRARPVRRIYIPKANGKLRPLDNWVFGDKRSGCYLLKFKWFLPRRHAMVKGTASPDDPRLREYWQRRREAKAAGLKFKQQRLARTQNFRCVICGEALCNDEELLIHHVLPKGDPQRNEERYQQLIHLMCHQQLTKAQLQTGRRQLIGAKRATKSCEAMVSA